MWYTISRGWYVRIRLQADSQRSNTAAVAEPTDAFKARSHWFIHFSSVGGDVNGC